MDGYLIEEHVGRMLLSVPLKRIQFKCIWVLCVSSVVILHVQNSLESKFLRNVGVYW